jgi:hypothetical protein
MSKWVRTVIGFMLGVGLVVGSAGCGTEAESVGGEDLVVDLVVDPDEDIETACVPDCEAKSCGGDGCGGTCGQCYTLEGNLDNGLCLADQTCTPCGCGERVCGTDLCGSPCGVCTTNYFCTETGMCELDLATCDRSGLSGEQQVAKLKASEDGFSLFFSATFEEEEVVRKLSLEIDNRLGLGGPTGPGEYKAQFKDFNEGGLWLHATITEGGVETRLTPSQGTINITSLDAAGGTFKAQLNKVVLQEVIMEDGTPLKVPNGMTWCLDGAELVAEMAVTPAQCGDLPIGTKLHKAIGNFQLQNCNGDWVDLYDSCQQGEALWVVATAGW